MNNNNVDLKYCHICGKYFATILARVRHTERRHERPQSGPFKGLPVTKRED